MSSGLDNKREATNLLSERSQLWELRSFLRHKLHPNCSKAFPLIRPIVYSLLMVMASTICNHKMVMASTICNHQMVLASTICNHQMVRVTICNHQMVRVSRICNHQMVLASTICNQCKGKCGALNPFIIQPSTVYTVE